MSDKESTFFDLAMESKSLLLGDFTLKSGKKSPYFFNVGAFFEHGYIDKLADLYSELILESSISFDVIFGPAYKGIPLVAVTAAALAIDHGINVPYAFNRKEAKAHGEGGNIVGAELSGQVLIVDDVITAGTAIRDVLSLLSSFKQASAAGVVIGLDRCEKIAGDLSASQSFSRDHQLPVLSIVTIEDLLQFLDRDGSTGEALISTEVLAEMEAYWQRYGASTSDR